MEIPKWKHKYGIFNFMGIKKSRKNGWVKMDKSLNKIIVESVSLMAKRCDDFCQKIDLLDKENYKLNLDWQEADKEARHWKDMYYKIIGQEVLD